MGLASARSRLQAGPTPIYYQLQLTLQKGIQEGRWKPGDSIPPERQLAAQFAVSVGTVRQAIANLVKDGYLNRVQGRGTFVRETVWNHETLRYYPMVGDFGDPIPDLTAGLIERKIVPGRPRTNRLLKISPNRKLLLIKRLIYLRRQPVVFSISHLPHKMFPGLETLPDDVLIDNPLYLLIEKDFGRPTIANQELFSIGWPDAEAQKLLAVPQHRPLLQIEMLSLTYQNQPYEHRVSFCMTGAERIMRTL